MTTLERELIEKIAQLDAEQQRQVLAFIQELAAPAERGYTVDELLAMPPEQRERAITDAFELAADVEFETFEAYSEEDLDDYSDLDDQAR